VAGIDTHVQSALAPTGRLRAGIAVGSAISATWAKRDAHTGLPFGPTVDLVTIFAARTGLDLTLVEYGSSGEIVKAALAGGWDVSFTPVDEERKTQVDFGPTFALSESTYMVLPGSSISNIDDVDRVGVRVFGVENTATIRAARRSLKNTTAVGLTSLEEVLAKFGNGAAEAIPGARILDGHFLALGTAVAVPRGNRVALDIFSRLLDELKADGTVRRIFDKYGMTGTTVAPAGFRP
jgi:polar amino acid transport system substrate-binding protein